MNTRILLLIPLFLFSVTAYGDTTKAPTDVNVVNTPDVNVAKVVTNEPNDPVPVDIKNADPVPVNVEHSTLDNAFSVEEVSIYDWEW